MPKERISHAADAGLIDNAGSYVEISWRREDRRCDCGTVWTGGTCICPGCGERLTTHLTGQVTIASVNPAHDEAIQAARPPFDGWRIALDEGSIDYLIAILRKARRQAFPKKEPHNLLTSMGFRDAGAMDRWLESRK